MKNNKTKSKTNKKKTASTAAKAMPKTATALLILLAIVVVSVSVFAGITKGFTDFSVLDMFTADNNSGTNNSSGDNPDSSNSGNNDADDFYVEFAGVKYGAESVKTVEFVNSELAFTVGGTYTLTIQAYCPVGYSFDYSVKGVYTSYSALAKSGTNLAEATRIENTDDGFVIKDTNILQILKRHYATDDVVINDTDLSADAPNVLITITSGSAVIRFKVHCSTALLSVALTPGEIVF